MCFVLAMFNCSGWFLVYIAFTKFSCERTQNVRVLQMRNLDRSSINCYSLKTVGLGSSVLNIMLLKHKYIIFHILLLSSHRLLFSFKVSVLQSAVNGNRHYTAEFMFILARSYYRLTETLGFAIYVRSSGW